MRRVNVIGISGSGKSFVADRVGAVLGLPVVRLDALRHGPGWTEVPAAIFAERVACEAAKESWVMDGRYPLVRSLIWPRADTVIWTDLDRPTVMSQVIRRSLRDWMTRREVVPGSRERLRNFIEPWHPIRWAWRHHAQMRECEQEVLADAAWAHLELVHLKTRGEINAFLNWLAL